MSAPTDSQKMTHAGVAVDLCWHDKVLQTYSFPRSGTIKLGSTNDCDIELDILPPDFQTQDVAFVDVLGGYHSMENKVQLPFDLRVKCRPLIHRKPPQAAAVIPLSKSEKTSFTLSVLLSFLLWFTIQKTPQALRGKDDVAIKTRILFNKKPIPQLPNFEIPKPKESPLNQGKTKPRPTKPLDVSQMLKNILGDSQGGNSADLIAHAQKQTGAQTFAQGSHDQWSKGPAGGESLGSGDRKSVDLPGGNGPLRSGRTMPGVSGLNGKVAIAIGTETGHVIGITGKIDRNAIREVIQRNRNVLQACYEKHLARNSDLYGRILLQWDIIGNGRVDSAKAVENSMQSKGVAECIITHLKTWKFPDPPEGQAARVTYPFVFSSQ